MSKPASGSEDHELIRRFKDGDDSAFDRLVEKYTGRAYQIAYGVLGSKEDAEEVAQDVFTRIYRALPKFRGDSQFTTWMYRIAMNLARNKYRWNKSRGSNRKISIDAPLSGDEDDNRTFEIEEDRPTPDRTADLNEFEKRAMEELHKLPELYREALVMRNVDEMSYDRIASILGCKLGTIKSRIARAREELRRRLEL